MKYAIRTMLNTLAGAQENFLLTTDPRAWTPDRDKAMLFPSGRQAEFFMDRTMGDDLVLFPEPSDGAVITVPAKL